MGQHVGLLCFQFNSNIFELLRQLELTYPLHLIWVQDLEEALLRVKVCLLIWWPPNPILPG